MVSLVCLQEAPLDRERVCDTMGRTEYDKMQRCTLDKDILGRHKATWNGRQSAHWIDRLKKRACASDVPIYFLVSLMPPVSILPAVLYPLSQAFSIRS
jgi:hypothetical protein